MACGRDFWPETPTLIIAATTKAGIDNLEKVSSGNSADIQDILPSSLPAIVFGKLGLDIAEVLTSAHVTDL